MTLDPAALPEPKSHQLHPANRFIIQTPAMPPEWPLARGRFLVLHNSMLRA